MKLDRKRVTALLFSLTVSAVSLTACGSSRGAEDGNLSETNSAVISETVSETEHQGILDTDGDGFVDSNRYNNGIEDAANDAARAADDVINGGKNAADDVVSGISEAADEFADNGLTR